MPEKEIKRDPKSIPLVFGNMEILPDTTTIDLLRNIDRKTIMHPFTPLARWEADPFSLITGAEGSYLINEKGERLLDGTASLGVNLLGHKNPVIDQAFSK